MTTWLDAAGHFFNPTPTVTSLPLRGGEACFVIDNALANPDGLVAWAHEQDFVPPRGYPYPGVVRDAPLDMAQRVNDFFALHVRARLGGRRTQDARVRLSMVTVAPSDLVPMQWQCHRDIVGGDPRTALVAASVLYLFRSQSLGGTSFYVPRRSMEDTEQMVADSQTLTAAEFTARYGVQPGYMAGSNAHFERVAQVQAVWNRMIVYNGRLFHSADVDASEPFLADPTRGRLTLNGFFRCRPSAT
jgi:Family of unknown function (DUF6445)